MLITTKQFFRGATELQFLTSRLFRVHSAVGVNYVRNTQRKFCQVRIPQKIHAYNHETVLLGCNGATISGVTHKILTGRQILSSTYIPLKIHAYNHETVPLGCNGAIISDVTHKILTGRQILSNSYPTENSCL